jgi:hypothetical protein
MNQLSKTAEIKMQYKLHSCDNDKCMFSVCENLATNTVYDPPLSITKIKGAQGRMVAYRVCKQHVLQLTEIMNPRDENLVNRLRLKPYYIRNDKIRFTFNGLELIVKTAENRNGIIEVDLKSRVPSPQS